MTTRALKIPRGNPVEAAKIIGKKQTILMDIGLAKKKKMVNKSIYFVP